MKTPVCDRPRVDWEGLSKMKWTYLDLNHEKLFQFGWIIKVSIWLKNLFFYITVVGLVAYIGFIHFYKNTWLITVYTSGNMPGYRI